MKVGVSVPTCREGFYAPTPFGRPEQFVQLARVCEALGFYSIWGNDHLTPTLEARTRLGRPPNLYESLITLAWIGSATNTIKVGTAALVAPLREVVLLAKQVSTLDVLSGGRMLLGVGAGVYREEFRSVRPRDRGANRGVVLEEALEALNLLFTEEEASFKGRYHWFEGIALHPKPVQRPLPVYLSGHLSKVLDRLARWGNGWLMSGFDDVGFKERIEMAAPLLEKRGRSLAEIDFATTVGLSIVGSREEGLARFHDDSSGRRQVKTRNLVGTPSDVAGQVEALAQEGITHVILQEFPVDTLDEMLEQVQRFGEEVLPLVGDL